MSPDRLIMEAARDLELLREAEALIRDGLSHLRGCQACDPKSKSPHSDCYGCKARRWLEGLARREKP